MKSKTSFSDLTTFKKDLTRFAPVWGLYLIGILMILIDSGSYQYDHFARNYIPELISSFGVINLIYAAVCGVMLFGDLYNTRMCYSLHTIPQRRETLFLSHTAAALCFSLVPNTVACLYLMTRLKSYWFIALIWLLAATAQFVFFFGIASLSAMLTGNRFAMLLVYAGINFVALLVYWILDTIYLPFMPGVLLNYEPFSLLTPAVQLFDWEYLEFQDVEVYSQLYGEYVTCYEYTTLGDGWGYHGILALVGIAASGIALVLYKLRHLETAGDFVAFPKLKNAACVIMTICVAGVAALLGESLFSSDAFVLWLLVGLVVGFFGSLMLLERRVRVFRKKTFLGFGVLSAVLLVSFLTVVFDVFGIVHWMPKATEVKSVIVANYYDSGNQYDYGENYYGSRISVKLTEQADIEEILAAHQDVLDRMNSVNLDTHRLVLVYNLNDGRTVIRSYSAPANGLNYAIASKYFYTPEQILGYTDWEDYLRNVEHLSVEGNKVPDAWKEKFLTAVRRDCEKGFITTDRNYTFSGGDRVSWMDIEVRNANGSYTYRNLMILPGAENTWELMNSPEFILGYTDWDTYSDTVSYIDVSGTELPEKEYTSFLEAMLLDAQAGALSLYATTSEYEACIYIDDPDDSFDRYIYITEKAENTIAWFRQYKESLS